MPANDWTRNEVQPSPSNADPQETPLARSHRGTATCQVTNESLRIPDDCSQTIPVMASLEYEANEKIAKL